MLTLPTNISFSKLVSCLSSFFCCIFNSLSLAYLQKENVEQYYRVFLPSLFSMSFSFDQL